MFSFTLRALFAFRCIVVRVGWVLIIIVIIVARVVILVAFLVIAVACRVTVVARLVITVVAFTVFAFVVVACSVSMKNVVENVLLVISLKTARWCWWLYKVAYLAGAPLLELWLGHWWGCPGMRVLR